MSILRKQVEFIAFNDEPLEKDMDVIANQVSVLAIAAGYDFKVKVLAETIWAMRAIAVIEEKNHHWKECQDGSYEKALWEDHRYPVLVNQVNAFFEIWEEQR